MNIPFDKVIATNNDRADRCTKTLAQAYRDRITGTNYFSYRDFQSIGSVEQSRTVTMEGNLPSSAYFTNLVNPR